MQFRYDALGRRVARTTLQRTCSGTKALVCTSVPGTDGLTYAYDGANHLLGEYALDGTPITEYVWFGDLPVAIIKGTGAGTQVFAVYSDHLNTPRVITDADGQVRWRWMGEPFGASAAEEQPTAGLNTLEQNLRFPGQQYEKFGGRHFNHFRDYDPRCWVPCDHVPVRSWALFKARDVLRELIRTLKAEQSAAQVA